MNPLKSLFAPKTANSKINALLGFMNLGSLTSISQAAKEKLARFTALAKGQVSRADAEQVRQDLMLQKAVLKHEAKTAECDADKAEALAKLDNLNDLLKVVEGILQQEIK